MKKYKYIDDKICIVGAGGFGKCTLVYLMDCIDTGKHKIEDMVCFMVADADYKEEKILGMNVIPQSKFNPNEYLAVVAVGDSKARKKIVEKMPEETQYATIIHPTTIVSEWVEIGAGSIVTVGVILTADIKIGKHAILNNYSIIGHDSVMGDYLTSTPAVNVGGGSHFGDCVYLGMNTSVRPGISICDDVKIGMGGIVVKNITEPGTYVGNPLKKLEK